MIGFAQLLRDSERCLSVVLLSRLKRTSSFSFVIPFSAKMFILPAHYCENGRTLHISPLLESDTPLTHHYKRVKSLQKLFGIAFALLYPPKVTCMDRGVLLKHFRPALLLLAVALFSASAWADGVDPKVIIQKGTGSIPITVNNPNPMFAATATTSEEGNTHCLTESDACVFIVFQNQTSQTLRNLTIAINDLTGFMFQCGDSSSFFSSCSSADNGHVTDVNFSGGTGILPAIQQCVTLSVVSALSASCQKQFSGGEFGLLIDATASEGFDDHSVSGTTVTTPEPDVAILMLSAAFAFGLIKLLRRGA